MKHRPLIILLCFSLITLVAEAQINIKTYTTATDTFYWKRYVHIPKPDKINLNHFTVSHPGKIIDNFLAKRLDQYPQFTTDSIRHLNIKDLRKCLFPIDINGDHLPDIIFSGSNGGESDIVRIYLNRKDSFELVFEDYQYISKFIMENGRLTQMQTGDVGCCDNYLYFMRNYTVRQDNAVTSFIRGKQVVAYKYTEEPRTYYIKPVPFVSRADTMLLRASAAQLNEPFNPYLETFGNIIAKYRTRSKGNILAMKSYGKGDEWYFVEIYPDSSPSASILYDVEKIPTFIRGWVSGLSISPKQE